MEHTAIFGKNKFEYSKLILSGWFRGLKITVLDDSVSPPIDSILRNIPLLGKYVKKSVKRERLCLGDYREGLWYVINEEALDLTIKFYDKELANYRYIIDYYNRILNTNKFEAYIKKELSTHIFMLLKTLHMIRLSHLKESPVLANKSPINDFVIKYMESKYGIRYKMKWVAQFGLTLSLGAYYAWLFKECIKRGFTVNKEIKKYKISMEAAWGFERHTLRNDIMIDNKNFVQNDILILRFPGACNPQRTRAFKEAKERGFDTASLSELKINVTKNIFNILSFYFLVPVKTYWWYLLSGKGHLLWTVILFHKRCLPLELFMNLYSVKCHISLEDWGGVEETIVFNKYGTKNTIFHWSDLTAYKAYNHAFIAHNIYFVWGDIHYDYHAKNYFVDKKVNIGCIFKREYTNAVNNKEGIINQKLNWAGNAGKIVTFFDSATEDGDRYPVCFYLEYLELIKEFCAKNSHINVLLKPKTDISYASVMLPVDRERYKNIWDELMAYENFAHLDPLEWSPGEVMAISDVCISMGMTSPSTIALLCGKEALYFDGINNKYHPFAKKYKNAIVFDNKDFLFRQIDNILKGRFNSRKAISAQELREFDTFGDGNELDRLIEGLHHATK